ncbi:MAG: hypothetical protein HOU01_08495, partial [Streptomycetaceae bacterium]|nr:hypothetical protein [Streptomycetaceae bacterium]
APVRRDPVPPPRWQAPPLPRPERARRGRALPYQPLIAPRSTAAVLQAALSREIADGEPDIPAAVEMLARCRPLDRLPRRPDRTLRFGVQVLVDHGSGMQPFLRDQDELVTRVQNTVGHERTQVMHFEDSPLLGAGCGPRWSWGDYRPPTPGTPVLALTDLGLGGPAPWPRRGSRREWERLAKGLRRAGCPMVVFLPYPRHRWPTWAADAMRLVPWDRHTTVGWVGTHAR